MYELLTNVIIINAISGITLRKPATKEQRWLIIG